MRSLCEPSLEQLEDVSATAVFERASIERAAFIIIRLWGLPDVFFSSLVFLSFFDCHSPSIIHEPTSGTMFAVLWMTICTRIVIVADYVHVC